ncbi:hypothetical protein RJ527_08130 [Thalassospiraceae bacterium LMO-SO8]|nr:hypothetical protein RJ527_08130 [Thalassospiraceae bacterium LMO-SO8]
MAIDVGTRLRQDPRRVDNTEHNEGQGFHLFGYDRPAPSTRSASLWQEYSWRRADLNAMGFFTFGHAPATLNNQGRNHMLRQAKMIMPKFQVLMYVGSAVSLEQVHLYLSPDQRQDEISCTSLPVKRRRAL